MKDTTTLSRRTPLYAALATALLATAMLPATALAQAANVSSPQAQTTNPSNSQAKPTPADKPQQPAKLEGLTVTGYRMSIQQSLEEKRYANAVVEVINAEDISKFPAKNVADALQRVPGVIITRDGGEGKSVSIRGLAPGLTLTLLNGNYVASSETNAPPARSFNYVMLPANMISNVELFKSPVARINEGGIGGTVILHTRRPLEMPANTGFVKMEGTYADTSGTTDPQGSALYSWQNQDHTFGILVGATYQKRTNRTLSTNTESWRWWADDAWGSEGPTDVNGQPFANQDAIARWWGQGVYDQAGNHYSGYWIPQSVSFGIRKEERVRKGTQVTLQFKPMDNLLLTANYFRFDLSGDYVEHLNKIPEWGFSDNWANDQGKLLAPNGLTFDPSGTIVTGAHFQVPDGGCSLATNPVTNAARGDTCSMETPQLSGAYSREKSISQTVGFEAEWTGDNLMATFEAGRTWSEGGPSIAFRMSAKPRVKKNGAWINGNQDASWDLTGTPTLTLSPDIQQNLMAGIAQIDTGSTDSSWNSTSIEQNHYQLDFTAFFGPMWMKSLQFGVKYRDGRAHRNTGNTLWYCPGTETRYQNCDTEAGVAQPGFFMDQPLDNIAGGFNANVFPAINYEAYLDYLNQRFGGATRRVENNYVYNVGEKISSGYVQLNFEYERLRGNLGVRVARTKQHVDTTDRVTRHLDYYADDANGDPAHCPATGSFDGIVCTPGDFVYLPESVANNEGFVTNVRNKTFTDVLPSLNVAYDLTDKLVLRGAASKVISRIGFSDLGQLGNLNYYTEEFCADRCQFGAPAPGWYGSGGNKDLQPYQARQFDVGLEWYFQPGSVLGMNLFHKKVKNFIVPITLDQEQTIDGETVTVRNYSTQANGRDGTSQGVEVYVQHSFPFGIGVQANYTLNDTNMAAIMLDGKQVAQSPLVGSADAQANLSVFYENEKLLVRASWNWRDRMVGGIVSGLSVYTAPYDQLDLNAAYNFTDHLSLEASVLNATKSELHSYLGNDTKARFYSRAYSGRQLYMGVTWKF